MQDRIEQEIALLRRYYQGLDYRPDGQWALVPSYPLPPGWNKEATPVSFQIQLSYPGTPPYGIYVPAGLTYNGARANSYTEPANNRPPFEGSWGVFSWQPADGEWRPMANITSGTNLLTWVRGFADRFKEGV
jgi:hypothetical protein